MAFRYHADHVGSPLRRTGFMGDFYESVDGLLSEEDQWRKLELVGDTARRVWTEA